LSNLSIIQLRFCIVSEYDNTFRIFVNKKIEKVLKNAILSLQSKY
jgi:hypothetical protein